MVAYDTTSATNTAMQDRAKPSADLSRAPLGVQINVPKIAYNDQVILQDLKFTLAAGKTTCLLGPSGAGKTSILKTIAGLLPLSSGGSLTTSDGQSLTGRISYMDQNDLLLPWAGALDNVIIADRLRGRIPDRNRAQFLLNEVGLKDKHQTLPAALSGGMKQRVALARTLMDDSPLVLVDEPFSALDAITRHKLQALFTKLLIGKTVLMITHDPMEALRIGHHVYVLAGDPVLLSPNLPIEGSVPRDVTDASLKPRYDLILSMLGMQGDTAS